MRRMLLLGFLLAILAPATFAKTALDLMLEGRFGEAKAILDTSNVSPRYQLLYFAMVEGDAVRACSLYQVVAIRYPHTDCDTVARTRLDQAQDIGFVLMPIAEWSQATQEVRPLALHRIKPPQIEAEVQSSSAAAIPTEAPSVAPPISVAIPLPSVPIPEITAATAEKMESEEPTPDIAVRDTIVPSKDAAVILETGDVDTVLPEPKPIVQDIPAVDASSLTAEQDTIVVPPTTPDESPLQVEVTQAARSPVISVVEKPEPEAAAEPKKPEEHESAASIPVTASVPEAIPAAAETVIHDRPASNGNWYIQVGAFGNYDNAHRLALRLQNAGFPIKLVPRDTAKGKLLQVRVGGYATREELVPLVDRLKSEFEVPTVIISD